MKHSVPHDLGLEGAKQVAESAWQSYSNKFAKYHPTLSWLSPNKANIGFTAKGISLEGSLEVHEKSIDLELNVPFLLKPFSGKAISVIEGEIKEWIQKAKAGTI